MQAYTELEHIYRHIIGAKSYLHGYLLPCKVVYDSVRYQFHVHTESRE